MTLLTGRLTVFMCVSSDYRLNPVLRKACKADIPKFCQSVLNKATPDSELEGQVISCLKLKYADQVRAKHTFLRFNIFVSHLYQLLTDMQYVSVCVGTAFVVGL